MGFDVYQHGIKAKQWPEPYWFFWGTVGFSVAGIVAMGNERLGVVLAWGLLIGALVYGYESSKQQQQTAQQNANPSAQQITGGAGKPLVQ